jgi:hypothetical protein
LRAVTEPVDCQECGAAGSVYGHFCEVCYADVPPGRLKPTLHPSIPVRFSDVMAELRAIAELASAVGDVPGERVAAACRRAESLLTLLRRQFLSDVIFAERSPGDRAPA